MCNEENKKLEVNGGEIEVVNDDPVILNLTIGNITIQYESKMTWATWIESNYNTVNASESYLSSTCANAVYFETEGRLICKPDSFALTNELIDNSIEYTLSINAQLRNYDQGFSDPDINCKAGLTFEEFMSSNFNVHNNLYINNYGGICVKNDYWGDYSLDNATPSTVIIDGEIYYWC